MRKLIFAVTTFFLVQGGVMAQQGEQALPKYKGYHQLVRYDSTTVSMAESGLSRQVNHKRIAMLDYTGCRQNSTICLDYDPLSAAVDFVEVKVYRSDGNVETIHSKEHPATIYDYVAPARMIYWGASQKMIEVGYLEPGEELEITTTRKGFTYALLQSDDDARYVPPMKGHFYDIVPFWSDQPIQCKYYRLSIPASKQLQYQVYNGEVQQEKVDQGDSVVYSFTKHDIMPIKSEYRMVAHNDVECKLLLSTAPNWQSKSIWFYGVNEDYGSFTPTPEVKAKVAALLQGVKNEQDSISVLTHWVADNIRYCGISMGQGEGYTLHNAQMNYTDRCGVCKDKAGMLVAMLRAAGFKSYAAMTQAGERIDRIPADQFNHSVCVVQHHDGRYELLDPTWVPNVRELWSSAEQQQGYLMGLPEGADLMETPVSAPENHYIRIYDTCEVRLDGSVRGTLTITAEGQSDASVRSVFSARTSEWAGNLEKEFLRLDPRATLYEVSYTDNDHYLQQPIRITYRYEIPNYAYVSKDKVLMTPITGCDFFRRAMSHLNFDPSLASRQYAFTDRCSRLIETHDIVLLPLRYSKIVLSSDSNRVNNQYSRKHQGENASYQCAYNLDKDEFMMIFDQTVRLGKRVYDATEWADFSKVVSLQKAAAEPVLIVK